MKKTIYIIRGTKAEKYEDFRARIFEAVNNLKDKEGIHALKLTLSTKKPPALSVIPFRKSKVAVVSIHENENRLHENLLKEKGFSGAYAVTEAIPRAYRKDWEDNTLTPGICLLTLFQKKKNLDHATFLYRWHNSHTPLSLKIHPLWNYNRNVVEEHLTEDTEEQHGIVEEHFRKTSHLLNPFIFFGNPFTMWVNMIRVYADTKSFLDYPKIEPYLAEEYHFKSR